MRRTDGVGATHGGRRAAAQAQPPQSSERFSRHEWVVALALGALGLVLGLVMTRHGVGTTDDGDTYLGVAHNLATGHGLTVPYENVLDQLSPAVAHSFRGAIPLTLFPPLFSIVLAPFDAVGIAPGDALRVLNPLWLGMTFALVGVLGLRITKGSIALAAGTALLCMQAYFLQLFGFVQSEPLYLVTSLAALLVVARYLAKPTRGLLIGFVVLAAAASCTRFVGISVIVAGALVIAWWSPGNPRDRWRRAGWTFLGALTPLALFTAWSSWAAREGRSRVGFHLPSTSDFRDVLNSVPRWLVPIDPMRAITTSERTGYSLVVLVVLVGVTVLACFVYRPGQPRTEADRLVGLCATTLGGYLLVVLAARTFSDASASFQFGGRLLVPALPLLWLTCAGIVARFAEVHLGERAHRTMLAVGLVVTVLACGLIAQASSDVLGWPSGDGVATPASASPTLAALQGLAPGAVVFTNDPGRVWRETGVHALALPSKRLPLTNAPNEDLAADEREMVALLRERGGYVVLLDGPYLTTLHLVPEQELVTSVGLQQLEQFPDGRLYGLP